MDCQKLFDMIDALNERYTAVWEDVSRLESPTDDKQGVDAVGDYFIRMAKEHGWQVETLELEKAGNPICITMNAGAGLPPVTFSGHIDTVHPVGLFGKEPVRRDDVNIYGPGVLDCKGGVVASVLAMDALERCGFTTRPVQLIIQTDEETGSRNSGKRTIEFMCEKAKNSVAFFNNENLNADSTDRKYVTLERKGSMRFRFYVHGKAAHGAYCPSGASAIAQAAHMILELEKMKDMEGLTCNCGVIQGGTAENVVAAECTFTADIRYRNSKQREQAVNTVQALVRECVIPCCTCEMEQIGARPAMELQPSGAALLERMNEIYRENGMQQLEPKLGMGGTDAAYIAGCGIPCVDSMGVTGGGGHSINEYAALASLAQTAKRLAAVAWCI